MKKDIRKLSVRRSTVRALQTSEMTAAGGQPYTTTHSRVMDDCDASGYPPCRTNWQCVTMRCA